MEEEGRGRRGGEEGSSKNQKTIKQIIMKEGRDRNKMMKENEGIRKIRRERERERNGGRRNRRREEKGEGREEQREKKYEIN